MLVLSRKPGEAIVLADQKITITILRTGKNQVRLGFVAPKEITIIRKELVNEKIFPHLKKTDGAGATPPL